MKSQAKPYLIRTCAAFGCNKNIGPERRSSAIYCSNICSRRNASLASNNRRRERYNKDAAYREKIKDRVKTQRRIKDFGMTAEEISFICELQNKSCAICKTHESELRTGLHLDHDHSTGFVRGFLCWSCNTGIGQFNDNVIYLQSAIEYLNKNSTTAKEN